MLNYKKVPELVLNFEVAVAGNKVSIVSPEINFEITLQEMPEKDNLLRGTASAAYHHCAQNNIPVDGDIFVVMMCDPALENGGKFQALFVPDPALRH